MTDVVALDLDWDFISHCADPEAVVTFKSENLSPDVLEDPLAREVYEFQLEHIKEHGKPATGSVLEAEFDEVTIGDTQTVAADLVKRLRERYARNEGAAVVKTLAKKAFEDPATISHDLITEGRRLSKILTPIGDGYTQEDFQRAMLNYDRLVVAGMGASLGFKLLDEHFYGQLGLTFLVGAPKTMKSWFTIKAFLENIMEGKKPYLASLELPAAETDMRLRCMAAKIPYWKYTKRCMTNVDRQKLEEASEILSDWGDYRIEKPPTGERRVEQMIEHARELGHDCIFIDQLQYMENRKGTSVGATNDTKDYFEVINDMRDKSDEGPIWCVHQFNRSVRGMDSMPDMQQIKGSSAVEECATLALALWATGEMKKSGIVHIGTLASRNYEYETWEANVNFKTSCSVAVTGVAEDDDEDDA